MVGVLKLDNVYKVVNKVLVVILLIIFGNIICYKLVFNDNFKVCVVFIKFVFKLSRFECVVIIIKG